jgi:glycerol uptake facilitator protein
MQAYLAEFIGTALLVLLGNGVVANVVLRQTKGHGAGWIVITFGWGMGVFVAVFCMADVSGAHINPAVTFGLAVAKVFDWSLVPGYIIAQMLGGIFGASLVYLMYRHHYDATDDPAAKLATFSTSPAIRALPSNVVSEIIGTFVLVFAVLFIAGPQVDFVMPGGAPSPEAKIGLGSLGAIPVGLLVFAIGLSLGGTTGYAINPARDLGPRIAHALLPIRGKGPSDWSYAWVPVAGPLLGGALAAEVYLGLKSLW